MNLIQNNLKDKFIYIKEKAIKKEHCNNVIKKINTSLLDIPTNKNIKNFYNGIFNIPVHEQEWFKDFCFNLDEYKKLHPFFAKGSLGFWNIDYYCNYQKYTSKQYYSVEHCEHDPRYPNRVLVWMFYCNNIKKGGGTKFPQQNFIAKPKTGTLLIWPAGWTHSHLGECSPNEDKYIVTGWCSYVQNQ
jgi:hypothetical protein